MRANMPPTGHRQVNEKPFKIAINSRESAPFYPLDLQKTDIVFGSRDEECACLMDRIESPEIDIAAIHDVNRSSLQGDQVKRKGIAHFTVGNMDKTGDRPAQIEQRVHFDSRFGR